jgi:hypothetical protein
MTRIQRLAVFVYCSKKWSPILKIWSWSLISLCILSGRPIIAIYTRNDLCELLSRYLIYLLLSRLQDYTSSIQYGYRTFRRKVDGAIWLTPYLAKAIVLELLPVSLGGVRLGFTPTGVVKSQIKERRPKERTTFQRRMVAYHSAHGIGYLAAFFFLIFGSVAFHSWMFFTPHNSSSHWSVLLKSVLFPGYGLEQFPSLLSPLYYTIYPPTTPPRRAVMFQDKDTGIWRPRKEVREQKWTVSIWLLELPHALLVAGALWANLALTKLL